MFDLHRDDKLKAWREFRDSLETSETPLEDVARFWSKAPFGAKYLDPYHTASWPDPWKLVIDDRYDLLAISLGMCYTFQLTARFKKSDIGIHMSIVPNNDNCYSCVIDNTHVLNFHHGLVATVQDLPINSIRIWG